MKQFNLEEVRNNSPFEVLDGQTWYIGKLEHVYSLSLQGKRVHVSYLKDNNLFFQLLDLPSTKLRMKRSVENLYEVDICNRWITVQVTEYIPAIPGKYDDIPENCYPAEKECIQYEAAMQDDKFNFFLNNYVFEVFDEVICKQLNEQILGKINDYS